jgi:hypothetical protein
MHVFLGLAAALLAIGLVVDLGFIQPQVRQMRQLGLQRDQLLDQIGQGLDRSRQRKDLARYLNVTDLSELLNDKRESDPLAYIGARLDANSLTRLELTHAGTSAMNNLQRTQFALRVLGSYQNILNFLCDLERGSRLATVDAFTITTVRESRSLEARLNISIYEPVARIKSGA